MFLRPAASCAALLAFAIPAAALAQESEDSPSGRPQIDFANSVLGGDFVTVGVGGALSPSYSGSDDYTPNVLPVIIGSIGGVDINPSAGGVQIDFIPDGEGDVSFDFGLAARVRGDRNGRIEDEIAEQYGELDTAIEVGPHASVSFDGVLIPVDSISVGTAVLFDVAGAHDGFTVNPTVSYSTPLSLGIFANLTFGAEWADENFQDYYLRSDPLAFTGPAQDALPAFEPDSGGFRSVSSTLLLGFDLDGNALNGGLGVIVIAGYSRLLGDAAETPFTSLRGSRDQFLGGIGLTYTFGL